MLQTYLSDEGIVDHICEGIKLPISEETMDITWLMGSTSGSFSVKTAWQLVRHRGCKKKVEKNLWVKGIPFKINFF